jgi:hypothetical protein
MKFMKAVIAVAVVGFVLGAITAHSRTTGVLYGEALSIESVMAAISSAGALTAKSMAATVSGIEVSTSASSSYPCRFAGSATSLPTSGYTECDTIYQLSDHTLYIATKTISAATDWKAVW